MQTGGRSDFATVAIAAAAPPAAHVAAAETNSFAWSIAADATADSIPRLQQSNVVGGARLPTR